MLAVEEVVLTLGMSKGRVYEMARVGILPVVRLGRQIRASEDKLAAWLEQGGQALPGGWRREAL